MTNQDPLQIAATILKLSNSGLFDQIWYEAQYGDLLAPESAALVQFCDIGWRRGLQPNICFDTAHYLAVNADVRQTGLNPLMHYLEYGEAEKRWPGPHFDPEWYRAAQTLTADCNVLAHYLQRQRSAPVNPNGGRRPGSSGCQARSTSRFTARTTVRARSTRFTIFAPSDGGEAIIRPEDFQPNGIWSATRMSLRAA